MVEIDNQVSEQFTVVDVHTSDRPGVLYQMTKTLTELGLNIAISKIATEGDRVADVFYVHERESGGKMVDSERLKQVVSNLTRSLETWQDFSKGDAAKEKSKKA